MNLQNFKGFPQSGRILAIDWGMKRIGLAVSDIEQNFAFARPKMEIKSNYNLELEQVFEKFKEFVKQEDIKGIVLGLPIRSDGTDSETTKKIREFKKSLDGHINVPIVFIEENLTSMEAQDVLGYVKRNKIKEILDSEAARVILENAIAVIKRQQL